MITAQKNQKSKPVVLVTGAANFIGSFLCESLLIQGCRVISFNNKVSGRKENLQSCIKNPNFTLIENNLAEVLRYEYPKENFYLFDFIQSPTVLNNLIILAKKNNSRIVSVWNYQEKLPDCQYPNLVYALADEVYGPRMDLSQQSWLAQFIKKGLKGEMPASLETENKSPVFVADAVYELIKIMFGLADEKIIRLGKTKFSGGDKVTPKEGIAQTINYFNKREHPSFFKFRKLILAVSLLLIALFFPLISLFINLRLGVNYLKKSKQAVDVGNFQQASREAYLGELFFHRGVAFSNGMQNILDFFNAGGFAGQAKKVFYLGEQTAQSLELGCQLAEKGKLIFNSLFQTGAAKETISSFSLDLDHFLVKVSLIESEVKNNRTIFKLVKIGGFNNIVGDALQGLPKIRELAGQAKIFLELLPILSGKDGPKTYLVLLQNSAELRPTGGFIGSYALVVFDGGKLANFEVKNVYEADGQLEGHVEPPPALKKYLNIANWYLRDANWSPDFPTSARKIAWFLEKETGQAVDGVIGVDLYLARRLLTVFKEIELPEYEEKITSQNIFEKSEYYSETNFFPGSTQKEDFLGNLARALFEKVKTSEGKNNFQLSQALYLSLKAKDIQFYLSDPPASKLIASLDWDGRIKEINCHSSEPCFLDYLMIIEANLGVNKANYFVKRNVSHQVQINSQGEVRETLKILYKNLAQTDKFPAGSYRNYLRILVPLGTKLGEVKIGNRLLERKEIEEEATADKTSFGFLVEIPIKEEQVVEISYQLKNQLDLEKETRYLLYWQKQAGIEDENSKLDFLPDQEISVLSAMPPAVVSNQAYQFNQKLDQDLIYELIFKK